MPDYSSYLLYTDAALQEFRLKYAADLEKNMQAYARWIQGLKLMEWHHFVRQGASAKQTAFIVGILCCLHEERPRRCHFSFNQGAYMIRRDPADEEEWEQWCGRKTVGK
ncbi:MAG: hypothetical protein IKA34_11310 [Bacteroidales bacterium]|nr:hypothetical protein [Bacteroidales bacterium]